MNNSEIAKRSADAIERFLVIQKATFARVKSTLSPADIESVKRDISSDEELAKELRKLSRLLVPSYNPSWNRGEAEASRNYNPPAIKPVG